MRISLLLTLVFQAAAISAPPEPPAKKELFARESWYKDQPGKEKAFVGVLERVKGKGGIGFGRFNPYRLVITRDKK